MKVSVVMTTYNGAEFILEQLYSLYNQEKRADEVIILDDKSNDNTVSIIEDFIKEHKLDKWKLIVNSVNVGWKQNFIKGFNMCTGDLIFPCDQDDIWHKDKLITMVDIMIQHTEIHLLVGRAKYIFMDSSTQSTKNRLSQFFDNFFTKKKSNTKLISNEKLDKKFKTIEQGCLMCFRRDFWNKIKNYWFPELAHDRLLSYYAKMMQGYYRFDYEVIDYRYHRGSASNPNTFNREKRIKQLEIDKQEIDNLIENYKSVSKNENDINVLLKAREWNRKRLLLVKDKRYLCGFQVLLYISYYPKIRRYVTDWIYSLKG